MRGAIWILVIALIAGVCHGDNATLTDTQLIDQWRAANEARDFGRALQLATAIHEREKNYSTDENLGVAYFNVATCGSKYDRTITRTSREKVECIKYALALLDSALYSAPSADRAAQICIRKAEILESVGMPMDAAFLYQHAYAVSPSARLAAIGHDALIEKMGRE